MQIYQLMEMDVINLLTVQKELTFGSIWSLQADLHGPLETYRQNRGPGQQSVQEETCLNPLTLQ